MPVDIMSASSGCLSCSVNGALKTLAHVKVCWCVWVNEVSISSLHTTCLKEHHMLCMTRKIKASELTFVSRLSSGAKPLPTKSDVCQLEDPSTYLGWLAGKCPVMT